MTQARLCAPAAVSTYLTKARKLLPLATTALGLTLMGSAVSAAPLQSGTYSFTINSSAPPSGTCTGPGDDGCIHDLTSVTIGATTYTDFTFPSAFAVGGFPTGSNVQSRIQGVAGDFVFSSPTYAADMLANVFSDMDLNRYQQVDSGANSGFSTFTYPNDVPATSDFFFITTERNGNNDQIIQAFDFGGNALGSVTVNRLSPDYTDTGVNVGVSQNGFISIIPMSDFNVSTDPLNPSQVRSLRISYTGSDGADHKTFIIGAQTIGDVVALDDDYSASPIDGVAGGSVGSVLANDDLNGGDAPTDGSATTITVTDADGLTGVSIADNGTITVPAGTPAGTYDIVYELCDEADPTTCDTATATVVVTVPVIDAIDDDYSSAPIVGATGGSVGSVLDNDTLGGSAVATDGSDTTISVTDADGLTGVAIADDGTINVPAATLAGTYDIVYEVCDESNPTMCDTATATVVVSAAAIVAGNDDFSASPVVGATGGTVGSVLDNDTLNGSSVATDGSETTLSVTDDDGLTGVTIADDGTITVPASTPIGTYTIEYQLCDELNPTNCATATATVVVGAPAIEAIDDTYAGTPVDGLVGGAVGSVLDNDLMAGSAIATDGSQTTLTVTDPDGLTGVAIADDGTITVPAGTPIGTYNFVYQLCDVLNPTNCDTATATVAVDNTDLLDVIEDDLTTILEDDLAATMADQSARMGDYATGALERLKSRTGHQCAAAATLMARNVFFDTDKSIIKPESDRVLDEIAAILETCNGSVFEIGGHTDSRASDAYNIALSQRRVDSVLRALTERGIDTSGFVARGYGERRPVASNATVEGMAQNRRVEFALIENGEADYDPCGNAAGTSRGVDANADETGITVNGGLFDERYDCAHDRWSIVEGTVSYLDTDSGLKRSAVNLSYRRERFVSEDSVRGYFVGLYGSQSDVDREATGEIEGAGLNAGIYGATRLRDNLYLDYYLGAAAGVHDFDLAFDDPMGVITATGDYSYVAGFAGAALSGDLDYSDFTLSPRAGVELTYAPGGDAEVEAALGAVTQSGTLELDSVSGSALFAEMRAERGFNNDQSSVALTPRLTCYQSLGTFGGECSIGASLELASTDDERGRVYAVEIEGERGQSFTSGAISASVAWAVGLGTVSANAGVTQDGATSFGGLLTIEF